LASRPADFAGPDRRQEAAFLADETRRFLRPVLKAHHRKAVVCALRSRNFSARIGANRQTSDSAVEVIPCLLILSWRTRPELSGQNRHPPGTGLALYRGRHEPVIKSRANARVADTGESL